jgi:hypothetical protein
LGWHKNIKWPIKYLPLYFGHILKILQVHNKKQTSIHANISKLSAAIINEKKGWITSCFVQQQDDPNKCMLNKLNKRDHLLKLNWGHPVCRWQLMPALL